LGSMRPDVSPAFQYAAQNYARLGGAQRLMDRPMEMMSVAERQRINEMAQGMAGMQRPTPFPGKGAGAQPAQPDVVNRIMPLISTATSVTKRLDQIEPRVGQLEKDVASIKTEVHIQFKELFIRTKRLEAILIGAAGTIIVMLGSILVKMG